MPTGLETVSQWASHGGTQYVFRHASYACNCDMTFSAFVPPQAKDGPCPVLTYLSGLTCTHANVTEKGEFRAAAAEHGLILVCPDTSPRGADVPDEDVYYFGTGAGFYVDASESPYERHYNMARYVAQELTGIVASALPADPGRQSIFGHSMGGHGALVTAMRNPGRYRSVSAFAPICDPSDIEWGANAFSKYLGADAQAWRAWNSVALIEDGHRLDEILIDQGDGDEFLESGLRPWLLEEACKNAGIPLTLRMQPGYDHSYYFISTFMADHIAWHAERLKK